MSKTKTTPTTPQIPMCDMVELLESLVSQLVAQAELRDAEAKIDRLTDVPSGETSLDAFREGMVEGYRKASKDVDRVRALLQMLTDKVEARGEVAS